MNVAALLSGKSLVAAAPSRYTRRADEMRLTAFVTANREQLVLAAALRVPSTLTVNSRCADGDRQGALSGHGIPAPGF